MKKFLIVLTVFFCIFFTSCGGNKFQLYTCGSGFYFNRSEKRTFKIKDLDVKSTGNYFYLDDYFCSNQYGKDYKIKGFLGFTIGKVKLAKKSEIYNQEQFKYNVDELSSELIITKDMNYVELYSNSGSKKNLFIVVEARDTALDLTLNNVNLCTTKAVPVIFSKCSADINLKIQGYCTLEAGKQKGTQGDLAAMLKQIANGTKQGAEALFYAGINEIKREFNALVDIYNNGLTSYLDYFEETCSMISDGLLTACETIWNGAGHVLMGKEGDTGIGGVATIMHLAGMSISGNGSLHVIGGAGSNGQNASNSLIGSADGGDGGSGGYGISTGNLLKIIEVRAEGGNPGQGGAPSKGLFGLIGSSGSYGSSGRSVPGISVLNDIENL